MICSYKPKMMHYERMPPDHHQTGIIYRTRAPSSVLAFGPQVSPWGTLPTGLDTKLALLSYDPWPRNSSLCGQTNFMVTGA